MSTAMPHSAPAGRESIITGEAIELEVRPASVPLRALAGLIDAALWIVTVLFVVILASDWLGDQNNAVLSTIGILALATVTFVIPFSIEFATGGRSLGKIIVGVRVLRMDGGPVRLRHVFVRSLVGMVENWLTGGGIAVIVSLSNARGQRLGDLLAGTYVVRLRGIEVEPHPLLMPPELVDWVRAADIAPIPSLLATRARIFLTRAATMSGPARATHAESLAAELACFVSPMPPSGTHPERFMAAVLVRKRNEEYLALRAHEAAATAPTAAPSP
ncbi:MAG: RDD family protein [Bowdeniella nasicola]|nr:RDD family protein [Bowdeniella nasicola]